MRAEEAIAYIHGARLYGKKVGLSNIRKLLTLLGNPHQRLRFVHVAGTNGKGSTCAMIESVLRAAGLHTGLYTSPFLQRYNERIRIAGIPITDAALVDAFGPVQAAAEQLRGEDIQCTTFEIGTALAFLAFERAGVELAVVEVGIGGLNDPTNIITPMVCAITAIGLDHTRILGHTLEEIAAKKAGIAKPDVPLILYHAPEGVRQVVTDACHHVHAPLFPLSGAEITAGESSPAGQHGDYEWQGWHLPGLFLPLQGDFQWENAAIALGVLYCLREAGMHVPDSAVYQGLAQVRWPGRLEWFPGNPPVLLDGAHNPLGMHALRAYLATHLPHQRPVLLAAVMEDKAQDEMLDALADLAEQVICTQLPGSRAWPAHTLAEALAARKCRTTVVEDISSALDAARQLAGPQGIVLCTGSLYLVGAVRALLDAHP